MKRAVLAIAGGITGTIALPLLVVAALIARPGTRGRQRLGERPRVVLGPIPLINSKYISRALQARGIEAKTFVFGVYSINQRDDFDYVANDSRNDRGALGSLRRFVFIVAGQYLIFARLLARFDIFHFYFDGGFLFRTPLRFRELALLHLAGKKVVVMPYGSDVAVPSEMRSLAWRHGLMAHYPELGRREADTRKRIAHFSKHADFIVACLVHYETLPRWDLLTTLYYPIDTGEWQPTGDYSDADGRSGPVTIVHAPNHRMLKGTSHLIEACRELEEEGFQLRLRLLEGVPNAEVRRIMAEADVVADQFILGFAMTALEGMSVGRPVLSNLSEPGYYEVFRRLTGLDHCPVVDTPPDRLKHNLRSLIENPALRREIGQAGRRYVEDYHAFEPVGRMWEAVYRRIWSGGPAGAAAWDPTRPPDTA